MVTEMHMYRYLDMDKDMYTYTYAYTLQEIRKLRSLADVRMYVADTVFAGRVPALLEGTKRRLGNIFYFILYIFYFTSPGVCLPSSRAPSGG